MNVYLTCWTVWNLKFVSYTSNLWEQMYDVRKHTMFLQKWILSPQDLPQNQSLKIVNNIFAYFTFSLSAAEINMVKEW